MEFFDIAIIALAIYVLATNAPAIFQPQANFERLLEKRQMELDEPQKFFKPFMVKSYIFSLVALAVIIMKALEYLK